MDKTRALLVVDSSVMRKIVERSLGQAGIELEKVVETAKGWILSSSASLGR